MEVTAAEIAELIPYMTPEELAVMGDLVSPIVWAAQSGPQSEAFYTGADLLFYGGSAGGGKSDLLLGCSLMSHHRSAIFRREATQLTGLIDRLKSIVGHDNGWNGTEKIWRLPSGKHIEFGSCKTLGDERKYQGRPHDLKGFDEITHFLESQFRYLQTWLRSVDPNQRCRVICTGNPPTDSVGDWVKDYWGPWIDPEHENPAQPGELRWFTTVDGKDVEVGKGDVLKSGGETIKALSRTFIPSKIKDNIFFSKTNYEATLQALPEPLRSQMLNGDFGAGREDDEWQIIPTEWIKLAQDRWSVFKHNKTDTMDALGIDPARGGMDNTVFSPRYNTWFDEVKSFPGSKTPDGPTVAALTATILRDKAPVYIDVIGIGSSAYDHLRGMNVLCHPVTFSKTTKKMDASRSLRFVNMRAYAYWKMRDDLDPKNNIDLCLPPGQSLRNQLTAGRWTMRSNGILMESKQDIKKRLGRSPDDADAVVMANLAPRSFGSVNTKSIKTGFEGATNNSGSWLIM